MNRQEVRELNPGLYKIYWKTGEYSYAAVGVLPDGGKWLAPINWVRPTENQNIWKKVKSVELSV